MFRSSCFDLVRRQAIAFFAVLLLGILATIAVILFSPRSYRSEAKLLLKIGRENVSVDPTVTTTGEMVALHRTQEAEVNTALRSMSSREVLGRVVDRIGADTILRGAPESQSKPFRGPLGRFKSMAKGWMANLDPIDDDERAVLELQNGLNIDAAKESSVVDVVYRTKSPEVAQQVVSAWVEIYRDHHAKINTTEGSLDFFEEEETELLRRLEKALLELQHRKSDSNIVTIAGEQESLQSQTRLAKEKLNSAKISLSAAEARAESLRRQLDQTELTVVVSEAKSDRNEARDRMRAQLYELEIQERRLAATYTPQHDTYVAAKQQLDQARRLFSEQETDTAEVTRGVNPLFERLDEQLKLETAAIASWRAELDSTQLVLNSLLNESKKLNADATKMAELQRHVDVLEARYRIHVEKSEQARLGQELENRNISNINVLQAASLEHRPVAPNKKLCGLLGAFGSFLSAFGVVVIRETNRLTQRVGDFAMETGDGLPVEVPPSEMRAPTAVQAEQKRTTPLPR